MASSKVSGREWLYKKSEDALEFEPPVILTATSEGEKELTVTAPEDHVISFGFVHQSSSGEGMNHRSEVVVSAAKHVREIAGNVGSALNSASLQRLTLGDFGRKEISKWHFLPWMAHGAVTVTARPASGQEKGGVVIVRSGMGPWVGTRTSSGNANFISIQGRGSRLTQSVSGIAGGSRLRWEVHRRGSRPNYGSDERLEVHATGYGRVWPPTGGLLNTDFSDGMAPFSKSFKYVRSL